MDDLYSSSFESDGEEDLATISKHVSAGVRRTGPKTKQVNGFDPQLLEDAVRQLQRLNHQRLANCSSPSTASQRSFRPVRNRTFTDDQVHRIDRENGILVRKIIEQQLRPVSSYMAINNNSITTKGLRQQQSSASINRRRKQQQIDHDNLLLLRKLQSVKPSQQVTAWKDQSKPLSTPSSSVRPSARLSSRSTCCSRTPSEVVGSRLNF